MPDQVPCCDCKQRVAALERTLQRVRSALGARRGEDIFVAANRIYEQARANNPSLLRGTALRQAEGRVP